MRVIAGFVIGVVAVIAAVLVVNAATGSSGPEAKSGKFQAVFLQNGQVYFGNLHHASAAHPTLTDVYYLTTTSNLQSGASSNSSVQLTKLGNELHGPEDEMILNGRQIMFWENLKDTGKVVQAIKTYQSSH